MFIKTFDEVISKDLLKLVQAELRWLHYNKQESIIGDGNVFFYSDTSNHPTHKILFDIFNEKFNLNFKLIRSYVNCYPPQIGGNLHHDDGNYTYLFFPDDIQNIEKLGDLQFKDGPTIAYKTNRLVVFDAKIKHKANKNLTTHMRHTIAWKTLI
jgi:hypothetical protein|tara:strand:+ start:239 stop:700 length:462 start_codon:yes stop_codon:yes gene_type:complete